MKRNYLLLFVVLFVFVSCENNEKTNDFENLVEVTNDDASVFGLPEIHFKFSYPSDDNLWVRMAEPGSHNLSYAYVDYMVGDNTREEISVGYCDNCNSYGSEDISGVLDQLAAEFEYQLPDFNVVSNDVEMFNGAERNVLKFTFNAPDDALGFVPGEYLGVFVVYLPKKSNNGIMFILLANKDETSIKDFSDFGQKGDLAEIFQTFRFVE